MTDEQIENHLRHAETHRRKAANEYLADVREAHLRFAREHEEAVNYHPGCRLCDDAPHYEHAPRGEP